MGTYFLQLAIHTFSPRDLDTLNVMAYDYYGTWNGQTNHHSPLLASYGQFSAEATLQHLTNLGADPAKLILGIPSYGRSFALSNPSQSGLGAGITGPGVAGLAGEAGILAYYEICQRIKDDGWTVVNDDPGVRGPYAFKGDQWVGFDDPGMVRRKAEFVKAGGYGGAMVWALDSDDFDNACGCEEYPLLKSINRVLRDYPASGSNCDA